MLPQALILMKVGAHAGESFDSILARKRKEFEKAGCAFWGYGGTSCHPLKQVRPFVTKTLQKQGSIYLFMEHIDSKANPDLFPATEYSEDGRTWKPIPEGVLVTGSKYALILDEIKPGDLDIPLAEYQVAEGPSKGTLGVDYLKGHVDKACLVRSDMPPELPGPVKKTSFSARLLDPYAVMVR